MGNDFSFDEIFSRQIEALGNEGDALFVMSTSGNSKNILKALYLAKKRGLITIGLTGKFGNKLSNFCDHIIKVPSENTARIQEVHILIGHIICSNIENNLFNSNNH